MEKERRFKLASVARGYVCFKNNEVYEANYKPEYSDLTALQLAERFPQDWQEVFEDEEKELTFPRMMLCGDTENESTWTPQRVIYIERELEIPFPFRTLDGNVPGWRFAKEIPQVKELTITEAEKMLSELKGEEIKIKEGKR